MRYIEIDGQMYPVTVLPPYEGSDQGYLEPKPILCVHERPEPAIAAYLSEKYKFDV